MAQLVKNLPAIQFDPWVGEIPWRRERIKGYLYYTELSSLWTVLSFSMFYRFSLISIFLSSCLALIRAFSAILNTIGEGRHICLLTYLREELIQSFSISMLAESFFCISSLSGWVCSTLFIVFKEFYLVLVLKFASCVSWYDYVMCSWSSPPLLFVLYSL